MAGFFENLLKDAVKQVGRTAGDAVTSFFSNDYLRDYTHASKTFVSTNYQNSPKLKFLFHVYFEINDISSIGNKSNKVVIPLLVKTVKLPSFQFDTSVMNQYNRKRIIQTKIKYEPIDITFHDDNGNTIRNMWYNYYTYHYGDALNGSYSIPRNIYDDKISIPSGPSGVDLGYGYYSEGEGGLVKRPFFNSISVYGFYQKNFVQYKLINPLITRFNHDTYNYAEGTGIMENSMTIDYEYVEYYQGAISGKAPDNIISGYGTEQYYDRTESPIMRAGANDKILGSGGLLDAAGGFLEDLSSGNILGAIRKAGTVYNTTKNGGLERIIRSEVKSAIGSVITSGAATAAGAIRDVKFQTPVAGAEASQLGTQLRQISGAAPSVRTEPAPVVERSIPVATPATTQPPKA